MNLTRVLNNALPDIPARTLSERPPRLDPGATFREHIEDGKPMVRIYVPSDLACTFSRVNTGDWHSSSTGNAPMRKLRRFIRKIQACNMTPRRSESLRMTWRRTVSGTKRRKRKTYF